MKYMSLINNGVIYKLRNISYHRAIIRGVATSENTVVLLLHDSLNIMRAKINQKRAVRTFLTMLLLTSSCATTTKDRDAIRNGSEGNQKATVVSDEANARRENKAVVENFFSRLEAMDIPGFIALWNEAGVQLMPFSPAGFPKELRGRAAIQKQYGGLPENYTGMRFTDRVYHETIDPEIFIVEYHGEINVKATGKPYNNDYIGVFRVKDGKLVKFTEYFNPIILQESFGADLEKNFSVDGK